jgi:tetratricopeptide (TPR) repeat protein
MSESLRNFVGLIPSWIAATQNIDIPAQPDEEELDRCVLELRGRLRGGSREDFGLEANDAGLAVLSRLCFELSKPFPIGDSTVCEAVAAHRLVSSLAWPTDLFGERDEILSQLALVARMQSGQVGTVKAMAVWEREYGLATLLHDHLDTSPAEVAEEAGELFDSIVESKCPTGLFDERDYLLGQCALTAGAASRQLGKRQDTERWLNRAESRFRRTLNPAPKLAEVAYQRLALKYDSRELEDVLELIPSLTSSYLKLGMRREFSKTEFLRAMTLKNRGRQQEASAVFNVLANELDASVDPQLLGQTLVEVGAFQASEGQYEEALRTYGTAFKLLKEGNRPIFLAHLKASVGETLVQAGQAVLGVESLREAISDYAALSMSTQVAYLRVFLAQVLSNLNRHREAEWEILAALPTIEEQKMVPEGFAAVALLRESVHRRKADPTALRQLREQLQSKS